jgi:replicative DNA helicase
MAGGCSLTQRAGYDQQNRTGEADLIVAKHRNGPTRTVTVAAQLHYARFFDMPQNPGAGTDWTQQREAVTPEDNTFGA